MPIRRPIIVLGAPRSGTTLLFSILASHRELWSLYRESEPLLHATLGRRIVGTDDTYPASEREPARLELVRRRFYRSCFNEQRLLPGRLSRTHTPALLEQATRRLLNAMTSRSKPDTIRFVDKNPRYCLRTTWLDSLWPDASYVFIGRDPRSNLSSLIEGWKSQRHSSFRPGEPLEIAGYRGPDWQFLRPAGWQRYTRGVTLGEVCAFQYGRANEAALNGLGSIPADRVRRLSYEALVAEPVKHIRQLCEWLGLAFAGGLRRFAQELPPVNTLQPPDPKRWERNRAEVEEVLPLVVDVARRLGYGV